VQSVLRISQAKTNKPLWKLSVRILAENEEAVIEALRDIFGQEPSVYVDAETQSAVAEVYASAKPTAALLTHLDDRMEKLRSFGLAAPIRRPTVQHLRAQDWAESWKRHFRPIDIRGRLLIRPSWSKRRARKGQEVVVLDPGLSFGTGQHATTRFCLEQVVKFRRPQEKQSILDIGTGSGILAIAAAKVGYRPVHALDLDPDAVRIAEENLRNNRVADQVQLKCRDVAALKTPKRGYDLVCANLIYDVLLAHRDRIVAQLSPNGALVLAGILRSQFTSIAKSFKDAGLHIVLSGAEGEWKSGVFVKK
jgi:ribosomal protein L11 methyltransferase